MTDTDAAIGTVPVSEQSRVLLAIHKAMRADSQRLIDAVTRLEPGAAAPVKALGVAFDHVVRLIHDHHWTEDDVIYPFLMARVEGFEEDAVRLENDHIELDAVIARISARLRLLGHPLSTRLWEDTRGHLGDEAARFRQVLGEHLDREEAAIVPAFDTLLSADDTHLLEKEENKHTTYRHMSTAVPWVIANATPEEEAALRAGAPRLMGIAHDHVWGRQFHKVMAPLYSA